MKNLLVKLLPLLAIVIATPAFAGTHDEYSVGEASALRNSSNRRVSHSENHYRHDRAANPRRQRVIIVTDRYRYSSGRSNRPELRREYRGYHKYRGHLNSYSHR